MAYTIKIQEHTSIKNINQDWKSVIDDEIVFQIFQSSSFQFFTEGAALGKLRDFELSDKRLRIELSQSPLNADKPLELDDKKIPPLLSTIFGLELLHLSTSVSVRGDIQGINFRSQIGNHIWGQVQRNKGAISSGKAIYLVSRHGYDVPMTLRQAPTSSRFPSFVSFQERIGPYIADLRGVSSVISNAEKKLIEWIFHVAENAFDHASLYEGESIKGYRGIILQKIKFNSSDDVQSRHDLPEFAKNFITQRIANREIDKQAIVSVATVVDLGIGIHKTVPRTKENSDLECLQYAFMDGVTSKNKNDNEQAGYGLGQMANAARSLKALIYIISANESAYYDFSDEELKNIRDSGLALSRLDEVKKLSGSAVSLMWAYNPKYDDQLEIGV